MITETESGLGTAAYTAVRDNVGLAAAQVILRRRNLSFSSHLSTGASVGNRWDAFVDTTTDRLWFAYMTAAGTLSVRYLANEDGGDQSLSAPVTVATGCDPSVRPSFAALNGLFYLKNDLVAKATSVDGSSWAEIAEWADSGQITGTVDYIAATSSTQAHIAEWVSSLNTHFITFEGSATGAANDSGIYMPHRLTGMDAVRGPYDTFTGTGSYHDIIAVSMDLPAQISTRAQGTEINTVALRRNAVMSFMYQRDIWSDHYIVEGFDEASEYQERSEVRISQVTKSNRWCLVSYGPDGNKDAYHASLHYSFTANGKYWELPELVNVSGMSYGGIILTNGDYTYLVTGATIYRSYSTELVVELDDVPSAITEDITNRVFSLDSSVGGGRQTAISLADDDNWFTTSMLASDGLYSLEIKMGVYYEGNPFTPTISHEIVEVLEPNMSTPDRQIVVKSRDFSALLNTHIRSSQARLHDTQMIGADTYYDPTGTGYGGMGHTAGVKGYWSTQEGWLRCRSSNERGVAFNTFKVYVWNGQLQVKFKPKVSYANAAGQFAGIVFRGYDKDNYYSFEYSFGLDELQLYEMRAGVKTSLASDVTSIGWSTGNNVYWLRVRLRYSRLVCEYSEDGWNWDTAFNVILDGKSISGTFMELLEETMFEEGQWGVTAQGYSDDDTWDDDPNEDPDTGDNVLPDPTDTGASDGLGSAFIAGNLVDFHLKYGWIGYTNDLVNGPWYELMDGLPVEHTDNTGEIVYAQLDPYDADKLWLFTKEDGIWLNSAWKTGGSWQELVSATDLQTLLTGAGFGTLALTSAALTMAEEGTAYFCQNRVAFRLKDYGTTVQICPYYFEHATDNYRNGFRTMQIVASNVYPDRFWLSATQKDWGTSSARQYSVGCYDWGTWPLDGTHINLGWCYNAPSGDESRDGIGIWVPYKQLDGSINGPSGAGEENQMFVSGPMGQIWKSENCETNSLTFSAWSPDNYAPVTVGDYGEISWRDGAMTGTHPLAHMAHAFRTSGDGGVADKLHILTGSDASQESSWSEVDLPFNNATMWIGGWPYADQQFYVAAGAYKKEEWYTGTDLLYYSVDGGVTWIDVTHNLGDLDMLQIGEATNDGVRVICMSPHFSET